MLLGLGGAGFGGVSHTHREGAALPIGPPPMLGSQCMQGGGREGPHFSWKRVLQEQRRGKCREVGGSLGKAASHPSREVSDGPVPVAAETSSQLLFLLFI